MTVPDAAIEAAAEAIRVYSEEYDYWHDADCARAAIEAAMPAIREAIAQEVEAAADPARDTGSTADRLQRIGLQGAARIVRGGTR